MKSLPRKRRPRDPFWDNDRVASAYECTGLLPALPKTQGQSYNIVSLYAIHDPLRPQDSIR